MQWAVNTNIGIQYQFAPKLGISIENIAASTDFTEEELAKLFNT